MLVAPARPAGPCQQRLGHGADQALRRDFCEGGTRRDRDTLFCGCGKASWSLEAAGLEVPGGPRRRLRRGRQCPGVLFFLSKEEAGTHLLLRPPPRPALPCLQTDRPWRCPHPGYDIRVSLRCGLVRCMIDAGDGEDRTSPPTPPLREVKPSFWTPTRTPAALKVAGEGRRTRRGGTGCRSAFCLRPTGDGGRALT